jgi:hypothetical protein
MKRDPKPIELPVELSKKKNIKLPLGVDFVIC